MSTIQTFAHGPFKLTSFKDNGQIMFPMAGLHTAFGYKRDRGFQKLIEKLDDDERRVLKLPVQFGRSGNSGAKYGTCVTEGGLNRLVMFCPSAKKKGTKSTSSYSSHSTGTAACS